MLWFFHSLQQRLDTAVATSNRNEIDFNSYYELKEWVNLGILFFGRPSNLLSKKRSISRLGIFSTFKCTECGNKFSLTDVTNKFFRKVIDESMHFINCKQHLQYELIQPTRQKSSEYIKLVNKLFGYRITSNYSTIMGFMDSIGLANIKDGLELKDMLRGYVAINEKYVSRF